MKNSQLAEIPADNRLIAYCGLYCGSCRSYLKGKCQGCRESVKNSWCGIKKCNIENNFTTCADCTITGVRECRKYNNFLSRVIGFVLNSDRAACIERIRLAGPDAFAAEMAGKRMQTIKRK